MTATESPASAATDPGTVQLIQSEGKAMNTHTDTTRPATAATAELSRLIAKARSIADQAAASGDNEEIADLTNDLLEVNNRIIQMPVGNLDDAKAKARHLIWVLEDGSDPLDEACFGRFLESIA